MGGRSSTSLFLRTPRGKEAVIALTVPHPSRSAPPSPILRTGEGDNHYRLLPFHLEWEEVPNGRRRALAYPRILSPLGSNSGSTMIVAFRCSPMISIVKAPAFRSSANSFGT